MAVQLLRLSSLTPLVCVCGAMLMSRAAEAKKAEGGAKK